MLEDGDITQAGETRRARGRPKTKSDSDQRSLIVEGARELFVAGGYAHTTMDDVAARCHVSKRTLYERFPGKAELFAAIVDAHRLEMLALPGDYDDLPLTEALAQIFRVDIDEEASERRLAMMRFMMFEARQFPELGELLRQRGANLALALLGDWLERQRKLGRISIDDTSAAAKILMDMIFGAIAVKSGDGPDWPGPDDRKTYVRRCIHVFVNGVRNPNSKS